MKFESNNRDEIGPGWKPTREFFLSNPRSAAIRRVCVDIVKTMEQLLQLQINETQKAQLYSNLEQYSGKLIGLGIRQGMHVGTDVSTFASDPVKLAEYVAGQLLPFTGDNIVSENEIRPQVGEMAEKIKDDRYYLKKENLPVNAEKHIDQRLAGNLAHHLLAIDE